MNTKYRRRKCRPAGAPVGLRLNELLSGNGIDLHVRVGAPQGRKSRNDILLEQFTVEIGLRMRNAVKTMEHLHIFVADQERLAAVGGSGMLDGYS